MSPKGKYMIAKHRGTGATLFNPKSSIRFFYLSKKNKLFRKISTWSWNLLIN
jgi:hypothetical protein